MGETVTAIQAVVEMVVMRKKQQAQLDFILTG
jgi:hypothetical protein